MSDIVERLRAETFGGSENSPCITKVRVLNEAADEIEKLRDEIKAINPAIKCRKGCSVVKERWSDETSVCKETQE